MAAKLDKRNPNVTEDLEHDSIIDDYLDLFPVADLARQDDKIRDLEGKLKKPKVKEEAPAGEEAQVTPENEPPKWFKDFQGQFQQVAQTVSSLVTERNTQTIHQQIASHEKLKNIPKEFITEWQPLLKMPEKAEEVDGFAEMLAQKYQGFQQVQADSALSNHGRPVVAASGNNAVPSKEEIDTIVSGI